MTIETEPEVVFVDADFLYPSPEECEELIANAVMAYFFKSGGGLLVTREVAYEIARRMAVAVAEYNE